MHTIITVTEQNLALYPSVICFINPKNECHHLKIEWLKQRFKEGLVIKLLQLAGEKKIAGWIEYVPGEYAWRAVKAKNYLFIHCLWVYPNKNKNRGLGTALLTEVINEAKAQHKAGVAVITSDGSFMAKKDLFLKNGFVMTEEAADYQLLVKQFLSTSSRPALVDCQQALAKYQGWHIVYSKQCPWVARFVEEVKPILEKEKLTVKIHEITSASQAQNAPSIYATFNLIKDGKILADRYISLTRFKNIVKKNR